METNLDDSQVLETGEGEGEATEETPEQLKARIAELETKVTTTEAEKQELESKNKQLFERAKKKDAPKEETFTPKDYLALTEMKVSSEDFDEVVRVSKILDKNIADTLKDKTMQSILKERVDERNTARATQTGGGRRASSQTTPEALFDKAQKGELNEADIDKLVEAELAAKTKK